MGKTSIEWTGRSFNPIRARNSKTGKTGWHCAHASPGCIHCYSENRNKWVGTGLDFKPGHLQSNSIEIFFDDRMLMEPLRVKTPEKWFPCSMTDLFGEFVKDEWIDRIFAVMALCPQHTFQVLTKRSEGMRHYLNDLGAPRRIYELACDMAVEHELNIVLIAPSMRLDQVAPPIGPRVYLDQWPLPNVWLGVSAEDQRRWDERTADLKATPAALRWVSMEPMLEPIAMGLGRIHHHPDNQPSEHLDALVRAARDHMGGAIHWVVVGGESGPGARPFALEWGTDIVRQCQAAGVPVFVKQIGAKPVNGEGARHPISDRKGAIMEEWPAELRVRQMPVPA